MSDPENTHTNNAGYSFIALVIASVILGYAIDRFAGTSPWGLIGFVAIGFIYATYKTQKEMNAENTKNIEKD